MCNYRNHPNRQAYYHGTRMSSERRPRTLAEWFEYGRHCFHQPDGVQAVAAMKKVTGLHPGYRHPDGDNPYFYLGKIYEVENRLSRAIIFYTRALALDPLDEDSLIGRGTCYTVTYQHEAAIYDFQWLLRFPKARRSIPEKHLFFMLAENYRRLARWGEAVFWGERAKIADPGHEHHRVLFSAMVEAVNRKTDFSAQLKVGLN
jgi:tetratricopeptide (TPR) repeat protein